jgi:2,3-bisphosphoglycerate-dependent phosphoglycerate mutase
LIVLRHGESNDNREGKFTGWNDVDLSIKGINQARRAGKILERGGYTFDVAYTSLLRRAIRTLRITLDEMGLMRIPTYQSWRLNEQHCGALQGLSHEDAAEKFGEEAVCQFHQNYSFRPPVLNVNRPGDGSNNTWLDEGRVPLSESMAEAASRFLSYWQDAVIPVMKSGKRVLIVAHGNILRSLMKHLCSISDEEIMAMHNPANGIPMAYEFGEDFRVLKHYYLAEPPKMTRHLRH